MSSGTGGATESPAGYPDKIILVYDGDSSVTAMLFDIVKKTMGREDCALCAITYGPFGKREAWRQCEVRIGVKVDALHRDQLPNSWTLSRADLPCVLGQVGDAVPTILVSKGEIEASGGRAESLTARIMDALAARGVS